MKENKLFKKADLIIIIAVILIFIGFLIYKSSTSDNLTANIYIDNNLVQTIELKNVTEEYDLPLNDDYNIILHITNKSVEFKSSNCKDHICVKTGKLTKSSDVAICAPAKVMVTLGENKSSIQTY